MEALTCFDLSLFPRRSTYEIAVPFFSLYSPEELYYRRGFARFLQPDRRDPATRPRSLRRGGVVCGKSLTKANCNPLRIVQDTGLLLQLVRTPQVRRRFPPTLRPA